MRHNHPVKIAWTGSTQIQIECPDCANDVRVARSSVHGISIAVSR